jgi:hypothetical protein
MRSMRYLKPQSKIPSYEKHDRWERLVAYPVRDIVLPWNPFRQRPQTEGSYFENNP